MKFVSLCLPDSWFSETLYPQYFSSWMKIVVSVHVSPNYILLIVSNLFCHFNPCATCFQSYINITCRSTQNDAHKYQTLLKITHNKTINKEKWNLNIINSPLTLKRNSINVHLLTRQEIWCLSKVRTRLACRIGDLGNFFLVFTKSPYLLILFMKTFILWSVPWFVVH